VVARAAAERDDGRDLQSLRELERLAPRRVVRLADRRIRVQRVAVLRERRDLDVARRERAPQALQRGRVGEHLVRVRVRVADVVAGRELDGADAERRDPVERLLERKLVVQRGHDSNLHEATRNVPGTRGAVSVGGSTGPTSKVPGMRGAVSVGGFTGSCGIGPARAAR
jgi:hypothetical protein